jgi:hypothetical protein
MVVMDDWHGDTVWVLMDVTAGNVVESIAGVFSNKEDAEEEAHDLVNIHRGKVRQETGEEYEVEVEEIGDDQVITCGDFGYYLTHQKLE